MRTLPQTHKHIATAILAVIAACGSTAAMSETVTLAGSNEVPPVTTSATGTALGAQTYRLTIASGDIVDRRRVGNEDNCVYEHYTPVLMTK